MCVRTLSSDPTHLHFPLNCLPNEEALISLRRISSIYLYQVYVPAASLVLVSWVTFWINGDKTGTPARLVIIGNGSILYLLQDTV